MFYIHLNDVVDPYPSPVLQRGAVRRDLHKEGLQSTRARSTAGTHAGFLLATTGLSVRRTPPHVEHDGAWRRRGKNKHLIHEMIITLETTYMYKEKYYCIIFNVVNIKQ